MSSNKYREHLVVLPEDDANRQIVLGFLLNSEVINRVIQVKNSLGGWTKVKGALTDEYVSLLRQFKLKMVLLLIDFDMDKDRLSKIQEEIPAELRDRVFVLGSLSNAEALREIPDVKSLEGIGKALAQDCVDKTKKVWEHDLLAHNQDELARMIKIVKPFLFLQN